ncbi:MAG TPA: efflux RND transporter periplasmic adaptor subunit [Bacilli bacterium]|nr:efflux RND transporter periplasmic adaptor subunit [Bacilli bacterium]
MKRNRKTRRGRNIMWIGLCAFLLAACANKTPAAPKQQATPVTVHVVAQHDLPETLLLPGRVVAQEEAQVVAPMAGLVQEVLVDVGDSVSQGQVLARLATGADKQGVEEARNALRTMEAQYARLEKELLPKEPSSPSLARLQADVKEQVEKLVQVTRVQSLGDAQTLRGTASDLAKLQGKWFRLQRSPHTSATAPLLQSMQLQIAQARQAVTLAEQQAAAGELVAPLDGTVLAKNVTAGAAAAPGIPLFTVGDLSHVSFEILVDPNRQTFLQKGQAVSVQVGDLDAVKTKLQAVSPALQPQTKSFTATAKLDNPKRLYKPGMFGKATVTLDPHPNVLAVPKAAFLPAKSHFVIKIGADNIPLQTVVKTGYDNGTWVEVLPGSGIKKGDRLILEGADLIRPGVPVNIVETVTSP